MTDIEIDDRIDRLVWKSIGRRSLRQVSEETGVPLEQLAFRRTELLDSIDELTIQQKRAKLLVDLQEIADTARDDYEDEPDKDKGSKLLTVAVGSIKTVLGEMRQMEKADTGKIEHLNQLRVRELLRLIDTTVSATLSQIALENDLDEDQLLAIFQAHLKPAAAELDRL